MHPTPATGPIAPAPEVLATLDRLDQACKASPGDITPQIELWTAAASLDYWVCINRGTPESPRPYMVAADAGHMLCVYSSAARAVEGARTNGLVAPGESAPLLMLPLPGALDWAMSFGQHGVVGVTIDYPKLGAWCPLPNLARFRPSNDAPQGR